MSLSIEKQTTVVIAAAGLGTRLGLGPKALLELNLSPLVVWVIKKALLLSDDVVVAVPPGYLKNFSHLNAQCRWIEGGSTRQESIFRLMMAVEREWLVILDGARPFFSITLMQKVLSAARETGVAGAFLPIDVPVALLSGERVVQDFSKDQLGVFQTPQAYSRQLLQRVYEITIQNQWQEQSTMQLALRVGYPVRAVKGETTNIKITTPIDWRLAHLLVDCLGLESN
ncbi:MAG: 2-C-methyl-D-erythritol 4-phosphate cytidylyltransferase [Magnetococcus sp. DMHC-6]